MKFVKVHLLADGVKPLHDRLVSELSNGNKVLWLVTGGSSVSVSVQVMAAIPSDLTKHLTIMLSDERYGDIGHADSNGQQLTDAGFEPKQARLVPILQPAMSMDDTTTAYAAHFGAAADTADVIIGQFGIGVDGHIAGILPGTSAVLSADLACGYDTETYRRITLTSKALLQINTAFVFAFGTDKQPALQKLHSTHLSIVDQPAQLFKQLPEAYIYNDQLDDSLIGMDNESHKQGEKHT